MNPYNATFNSVIVQEAKSQKEFIMKVSPDDVLRDVAVEFLKSKLEDYVAKREASDLYLYLAHADNQKHPKLSRAKVGHVTYRPDAEPQFVAESNLDMTAFGYADFFAKGFTTRLNEQVLKLADKMNQKK